MQTDNQQANIASAEVKKKFDDTLARHMKSSIGVRLGKEGLCLDMTTVSCLVILAERESERKSFPSDPPERFTRDSFLEELEEMGLDSHGTVQERVEEMIDKGYIGMESDGRFLAGKPTMDMAGLLDKAFPGMPGMNLVAYLIQTLDEALSGRKDPEFAVIQLDQTLKIHGGGLRSKPSQAEQASPSIKGLGRKEEQSAEAIKSALSATIRKRQAEAKACHDDSSGQPKIVTASGTVKTIQVKEVFPKHDGTSEALEEPLADKDIQEPTTPEGQYVRTGAAVGTGYGHPAEDSQELSETTSKVLAETDLNATKTQDISSLGTKATEEQPWGQASTAPLSEPEDHALALAKPPADKPAAEESCHDRGAFMEDTVGERTLAQGHMAPLSDEALEERISAFEQDLAMACPVCSRGKIEKKDTAKGKSFYVCNQEACVFVSWGKPFHLECPRCKNPFLIQATAKAGETVLRCPRATCRYQQGMPEQKTSSPAQAPATAHGPTTTTRKVRRSGKKKRVVRRRVVRKKR